MHIELRSCHPVEDSGGGANLMKKKKGKLKLKLNSLSELWFGDEKPVEVIIVAVVNNG